MSKSKPRKICGYMGCTSPVGPDKYGAPRVRCLEHKGKQIYRNGVRVAKKPAKPVKTVKKAKSKKRAKRKAGK